MAGGSNSYPLAPTARGLVSTLKTLCCQKESKCISPQDFSLRKLTARALLCLVVPFRVARLLCSPSVHRYSAIPLPTRMHENITVNVNHLVGVVGAAVTRWTRCVKPLARTGGAGGTALGAAGKAARHEGKHGGKAKAKGGKAKDQGKSSNLASLVAGLRSWIG